MTMEINNNSKKNKAPLNVASIIDSIPSDIVNEPSNTNNEICDGTVPETILKLFYDQK